MTSQKHGVSALGLQRVLGLGSYQTAWTMLHRLRRAMVRPARDQLSGKVEVDETYVGGPGRGLGRKNTIHMRHWRSDTTKAIGSLGGVVKQLLKSAVLEICMRRSVGAGGG